MSFRFEKIDSYDIILYGYNQKFSFSLEVTFSVSISSRVQFP